MNTKSIQLISADWYVMFVLMLVLLASGPAIAVAETDNDALSDASATVDSACTTQGDVNTAARLAEKFSTLAGSAENATALVNGLLTGTSVTLSTTVNGEVTTSTFTPVATTNNNYGTVFLSLKLAQEELAQLGITNPTPAQLEAVLNGGTITTTSSTVTESGILALRASGQTWSQIATTLDVKLGHVLHDSAAAIAAKFTTLAGSEANATALVNGLLSGSSISLTETVNGEIVTTTFTPVATNGTGYGSVFISLKLAQEELTKLGITNPTPAQIEAVLNGGTVTTTTGTVSIQGILAMRAAGQGWGQIAKALDLKLGHVRREAHEWAEHRERSDHSDAASVPASARADRAVAKAERNPSTERPVKVEKVADRVERVTTMVDRPVRVEKPVRPEGVKH